MTTADPPGEAEAGAGLQEGQVLVLLLGSQEQASLSCCQTVSGHGKRFALWVIYLFFFFLFRARQGHPAEASQSHRRVAGREGGWEKEGENGGAGGRRGE